MRIEVARKSSHAILVVQDQGLGIPKSIQPKIFERFERAQASRNIGGLGLGLYISKSLVEAHGGTIALESQESLGAKFTISLPLAR